MWDKFWNVKIWRVTSSTLLIYACPNTKVLLGSGMAPTSFVHVKRPPVLFERVPQVWASRLRPSVAAGSGLSLTRGWRPVPPFGHSEATSLDIDGYHQTNVW